MFTKIALSVASFFISFCAWSQKGLDSLNLDTFLSEIDSGLVVIGEAHAVAGTHETEHFILSHFLNKGYNTILIEAGPAEVAILNRYLQYGDESLLDFTRARVPSYKSFIRSLRLLHLTYPFDLVGFDFDRSVCVSFVFDQLLSYPDKRPTDSLRQVLQQIKSDTKANELKKILLDVKEAYLTNRDLFKELILDQEQILFDIITNPVFMDDFGLSSKKRDQQMLERLHMIHSNSLSKALMIVGSNHLTNEDHLFHAIALDQSFAVQWYSLLFSYSDCENFIRRKRYNSETPLFQKASQLEEAAAIKIVQKPDVSFWPWLEKEYTSIIHIIGQ